MRRWRKRGGSIEEARRVPVRCRDVARGWRRRRHLVDDYGRGLLVEHDLRFTLSTMVTTIVAQLQQRCDPVQVDEVVDELVDLPPCHELLQAMQFVSCHLQDEREARVLPECLTIVDELVMREHKQHICE